MCAPVLLLSTKGAAGKRLIAPPTPFLMAPPVDIVRRICFSLKLGNEGFGGVADGGEDGGVGRFGVFKLVDITVNRIRFDVIEVSKCTGDKVRSFTQLGRHLCFNVTKKRFKTIVQVLKITGAIFLHLDHVDIACDILNTTINCMRLMLLVVELLGNNIPQRTKNSIKNTITSTMLNLTIKPLLHFLLNLLYQLPKPLRHLTRAHALPKSADNFRNLLLIGTLNINLTKPLEKADDKIQHGVADLVLRDVRGKNAAAGDYRATICFCTTIPNELLQSLGQLANEAIGTTTRTIQSLRNLINLRTQAGTNIFNFV
ncbi:EAL domain-containing protein [Babesia caballi]|uniref:EAL domain-containing protein n=1 Tax=Babesia caballi TaxID=5871 RepID=A0AAV4M1T6_BABCB|nr:EAL domain-containing protein [Babesia caballi]